jgi:hypothetical protein
MRHRAAQYARIATSGVCIVALAFALGYRALADDTFAPSSTPPREQPRDFEPFKQIETHRIRITNAAGGPVQVSDDDGKTWTVVGTVTAPATDSLMGYLASGYAPPGTVAAVAVHGIRVRVGDLTTAYPKMVSILPREFAQTPVFFGGHISGASGIYTDIPTGTSIFRELSPYSGNPVFIEGQDGQLGDLQTNYKPKLGDVLDIIVKRPANPLVEVDFDNVKNGKVIAKYASGATERVTTVLKPVYGVGRYDATSYTGVGAINTTHTGVLTVSTAPVSTSTLLEGTGEERRGGFQIQPSYHNTQSQEAWAPSVMVLGTKGKEREPDLEGTPPLFMGHFDLSWLPGDMEHSWRAEVQYDFKPRWEPMPKAIGTQNDALRRVTAIRLIRGEYGNHSWLTARIDKDADAYRSERMAMAASGKIPVKRGRISIDAGHVDPRTKFVAFYIDGTFRNLTNTAPFSYSWDTGDSADGEHVIEIVDEDENNNNLKTKVQHVWVDNAGRISSAKSAGYASR